ncbi:MAG: hypothetical protein A2W33_03375 [Chloroflexi bacterium RBG_16_52_11]|nr:MAG: hypothetical protein A2W33_03375 [Chloroflexi bacterium RBG_16_52_11]
MRRIVPIVLIGMGVMLLFSVGTGLYFNNLLAHPAAVPLPDRVAGLQMTDYTTGAQAASEFKNLHDTQFPLTSGAIAFYGDRLITLWVAGAPLDFMAARMLAAMQGKIAQGNSLFTPMTPFIDGKRTVYVLEGMGQRHFYFQSDNLVIWLAADPAVADAAIKQILEAYP